MEFHADDVFENSFMARFRIVDVPFLRSALTKKTPLTPREQEALDRALADWEAGVIQPQL